MIRPDFIHRIELTATTTEQENVVGWNDPCKEGYELIVFLDTFHFRKNQNIKKVAWKINYIFLIELICAMSILEGLHDGKTQWCGETCLPQRVVEKMGFYYGFKTK